MTKIKASHFGFIDAGSPVLKCVEQRDNFLCQNPTRTKTGQEIAREEGDSFVATAAPLH